MRSDILHTSLDSSWLDNRKWSWIPLLTTPTIFIASGLVFLVFILSDDRYKHRETLIIVFYLVLFILTLVSAIYLFFVRLDHLAGLITAVFSSNFAYILNGYENMELGHNSTYNHPFEIIGNSLAIWSVIACLFNVSPGVLRASKQAFFLSNFEKNEKMEIVMILGVCITTVPIFTVTVLIVDQIVIPEPVIVFLFQFWILYLPIAFAFFLGIAWVVGRPYPEDALKISTWIKTVIIIYLLNFICFLISFEALSTHSI